MKSNVIFFNQAMLLIRYKIMIGHLIFPDIFFFPKLHDIALTYFPT